MANWGFLIEFMVFILPIWTSFLIGIVVGWAWKPSWSNKIKFESFLSKIVEFSAPNSSSSNCNGFSSISQSCKVDEDVKSDNGNSFSYGNASCSSSKLKGAEIPVVNDSDLIHLHKVAEEKDGGPAWIQMMDRSTPNMSYRAWRRDPPTGPPQYRSSTIYEDVTPELMKDFFWDDEFRSEWDTMLIHHETLDASKTTGTMIVKWIRKFPFFCSDREYIIGRRVWECGQTFYCVTKGIPNNVPRKNKPRRVDLYYSSWCIRAAESKRTGQMTACEVLLFHHEDMGIPWEIAKLGVRQGMWGAVKMIDPGLRAYQKARGASDAPLSPSATMAHITTKVSPQYLKSVSSGDDDQSVTEVTVPSEEKPQPGMNVPKLLVFGGAVALACSLDRGLLTKAVIFGVARKLGRIGGKL